MVAAGVLSEVETVMNMDLPADAPGLRAVGAPELMTHLKGAMPLEEAIERAKMETRRYAKRQSTWIRNQMQAWTKLDPTAAEAMEMLIRQVTCSEG